MFSASGSARQDQAVLDAATFLRTMATRLTELRVRFFDHQDAEAVLQLVTALASGGGSSRTGRAALERLELDAVRRRPQPPTLELRGLVAALPRLPRLSNIALRGAPPTNTFLDRLRPSNAPALLRLDQPAPKVRHIALEGKHVRLARTNASSANLTCGSTQCHFLTVNLANS